MHVKWKSINRDENDVRLLLNQIEPHIRVDSKGAASIGIEADIYTLLISEYLIFNEDVPSELYKWFVQRAVGRAVKLKSLVAATLLSELDAIVTDFLRKPVEEYLLLTSISVSPNTLITNKDLFKSRRLNFSRIQFHARPPRRLSRVDAVESAKLHGYEPDPPNYSFVTVRTRGRTIDQAVNAGLYELDVLRGMWNLAINANRKVFAIGGGSIGPSNSVLRGPISTLHEIASGDQLEGFWVEESISLPIKPDSSLATQKERMLEGESFFRRKLRRHPFRGTLERWIVDYCEALDGRDHNLAMVSLWRLLERMCGIAENEKHTEIAKRVSFLYSDRDLVRITLERFRQRRNEAVHNGIVAPHRYSAIVELKGYVEQLFRFYLRNDLKFSSREEFVGFIKLSADLNQIQSEIRIRDAALRFHNPPKKPKRAPK